VPVFLLHILATLDLNKPATLQLADITLIAGPAGSLDVSTDVNGTCAAGNVSLCAVWALLQSVVAENALMRQEIDALKSSVQSIPQPSDPNTFLLLHLDTSLVDSSTYKHAVSSSGGAAISSTEHKFGVGSAHFDGSDDVLTIPQGTHTAVGNSDFTMELWVYPQSGTSMAYAGLVGTSKHSLRLGNKFEIWTNRWRWLVRNGDGSDEFDARTSSGSVKYNQWTHLAGVRHNDQFKFYVDGSLIKQGDAFDLTATDVLAWNIGVRNLAGYSGVHFKGYIDEVRLSKVARYTGSFTPENKAFTN